MGSLTPWPDSNSVTNKYKINGNTGATTYSNLDSYPAVNRLPEPDLGSVYHHKPCMS